MASPIAIGRAVSQGLATIKGATGTVGTSYYVDPVNGSDSNNGLSPSGALASLSRAHTLCTAGQNDTVFLVGNGAASGTARISSKLVWSKNATNLVGIAAPSSTSCRARISHASTAPTTVFTPMVEVTADGCRFENISIFEGFNPSSGTATVTWEDKGNRNHYRGVHVQGMGGTGNNPSAAEAGSACMLFTGGGEHLLERCVIGLDTVARTAANASVRFRSESARVKFLDCEFLMHATETSPLYFDANAANSLNRWAMFRNCIFNASLNISPVATPAVAGVVHASANGTVILHDCSAVNLTAWAAASARVKINMTAAAGGAGITADSA